MNEYAIRELINFFFDNDLLNSEKVNHLDTLDGLIGSMVKLYNLPSSFHNAELIHNSTDIKAHVSCIEIEPELRLIQHHCAKRSYDNRILRKMELSLVENIYDSKWICTYYQPSNIYMEKIFGNTCTDIDNDLLCNITQYGFAYLPDQIGRINDITPDSVYYMPLDYDRYANKRNVHAYIDADYITSKIPVFLSGKKIGMKTTRRSPIGYSFSNLLNCDIYDFDAGINVDWRHLIPNHQSLSKPVLWSPIDAVNYAPDKIYNFWKIRSDLNVFKYFKIPSD